MVSGFFTSPCDHSRIFSGLASEMRIALKESGSLGFSKNEKMSRIGATPNFANVAVKTHTRGFTGRREGGKGLFFSRVTRFGLARAEGAWQAACGSNPKPFRSSRLPVQSHFAKSPFWFR